MQDFRKRYRQVDVLLMDDIQFIAGKESTQEEFFHTFNALRDGGRQIVLSSDRAPKAMATLEERLKSRFEWGLTTDVQVPDLETRMAILRKKCDLDGITVKNELIELIASMFTHNIRRAGRRSDTHSRVCQPDRSRIKLSRFDRLAQAGSSHTAKTANYSRTNTRYGSGSVQSRTFELRSSKRSQDLALPRHIAMYLAHELCQMSFPRIGTAFGNRKHTSAIYAIKKIREEIESDVDLSDAIRRIRNKLGV